MKVLQSFLVFCLSISFFIVGAQEKVDFSFTRKGQKINIVITNKKESTFQVPNTMNASRLDTNNF